MDGIGGTIKRMVFRKVMSKHVVINSAQEFAEYADSISKIVCLYLPAADLIVEPSIVADQKPIPDTLQIHKFVREFRRYMVPLNKFYHLSEDTHPHYKQYYGLACGHPENDVDHSTCGACFGRYKIDKDDQDWIDCKICNNWFHEQCFMDS